MTMVIRSITDIGNDRDYTDDSCYYDEKKGLMVMADGMGGYAGGRVASAIAVKIFATHYIGVTEETYQRDLTDLFTICNDEIVAEAKKDPLYSEMGTTLTTLCFHEDRYYIGHIGDSRAYLCRGGKLRRLTEDHNMVGALLKSGQISKKEAHKPPGRNMLTRVIGRKPLPEIDFYSGDAQKNDIFLLCTDGMSGYLDDKRMAAIIKGNNNLEHALNTMVKKVLDRGGKDNITAILAKKL